MQLLVEILLRKNRIAFDRSELEFQIQSHPSYPSLHAITGVLDHFNITNVAARVPQSPETLDQLPDYFIAQMQGAEMNGLYVLEKGHKKMKLHDENGNSKPISSAAYLDAFTGIILAVEQTEEQALLKPKPKVFPFLSGILIALMGYFFASAATSLIPVLMILSALIGLVVSFAVIQQEFGIKNKIGETFCDGTSKSTDCQTVFNSTGARLFGTYKLSELSLVYFLGFTLATYLLTLQGLNLGWINVIGLLSLPITLYSIYYQLFKLKKWCLLCLSIVGVLWIQGGISISYFTSVGSIEWNIPLALNLLLSLTLSLSAWSYLKPQYKQREEFQLHKIGHYKFKKNFRIFNALLLDQPAIETTITGLDELVFGNPESKVEILFVTNPFCGHCKPVHAIIEDTLSKHGQDIRVVIRFNIGTPDTNNDLYQIAAILKEIYLRHGEKQTLMAMDEVFNKLKISDWIERWSIPDLNEQYHHQQLALQKNWCSENKVNFTPVLLINGYQFPQEHERKDLLFFIDDLLEAADSNSKHSTVAV